MNKNTPVSLGNISINDEEYPTIYLFQNGVLCGGITETGGDIVFRQYNTSGTTKFEITLSELSSHSMIYKGEITDCLLQTTTTGMYYYDGSKATNTPDDSPVGCIYTFNSGTIFGLRIALTSHNKLFTSIYIPGSSYGTWEEK